MVSDLVPPQIPLVLHRLVAFVATHVAPDRVHVKNVLFQIELIGEVAITVDTEFGLARLPFLAFYQFCGLGGQSEGLVHSWGRCSDGLRRWEVAVDGARGGRRSGREVGDHGGLIIRMCGGHVDC